MDELSKADFFSTNELIMLYQRLNTSFEVVAGEIYLRAIEFIKQHDLVGDTDNVAAEILNNYEVHIIELAISNPKLKSVIELVKCFHDWRESRRLGDISQNEEAVMNFIFYAINACELSSQEKGFNTGKSKHEPKKIVRAKAEELKQNNKYLNPSSISKILAPLIKKDPESFGFKSGARLPSAKTLENSWVNKT